MEKKEKNYDCGVIIGRFQTSDLHSEHIKLIDYVLNKHQKVIILLGISPVLGTRRNPLDFQTRKIMIENKYPQIIVLPLQDKKSDEVWSKQVDTKIREILPTDSIVIYGGKESFIPHYKGQFDTIELIPDTYISATNLRLNDSKKVLNSTSFRIGVISGVYNTFPTVYSTIDVAIFDDDKNLLLGKKPNEDKWRFIGGFVDVSDETEIDACKREGREETGLELGNFSFVGSLKVNDWRYKNDSDRSIMTHFYKCNKIFGCPEPGDDIENLKWVKFDETVKNILTEEHQKLFELLYNTFGTNEK